MQVYVAMTNLKVYWHGSYCQMCREWSGTMQLCLPSHQPCRMPSALLVEQLVTAQALLSQPCASPSSTQVVESLRP